jgi:hypothetical protein
MAHHQQTTCENLCPFVATGRVGHWGGGRRPRLTAAPAGQATSPYVTRQAPPRRHARWPRLGVPPWAAGPASSLHPAPRAAAGRPTISAKTKFSGGTGGPGRAAQQGELAGVRHRVGEGPLEELLVGDGSGEQRVTEIALKLGQGLVEALHLGLEGRHRWRRELTPAKHRAGIADYAGHMPDEFVRRSHVRARPEVRECRRSIPERLLGTVGNRSEEVLEQVTRRGHRTARQMRSGVALAVTLSGAVTGPPLPLAVAAPAAPGPCIGRRSSRRSADRSHTEPASAPPPHPARG